MPSINIEPGDVVVSVSYLLRLLSANRELELLEAAGVDNWEGYSEVNWDSLDEYNSTMEGIYRDS